MKFRVKTSDNGCIQYFSKVVSTISKLAKSAVLRITKEKIYFVLSEKAINGGVAIWCELNQDNFFQEHAMEGLSAEDDEIMMEVILEQFVRCFRQAASARSFKLKLMRKITPCLTIEMEQPTSTSRARIVTHDIPVRIVPRRMWDEFLQPPDPEFDVSIYFPQLKVVRQIVERMKNLSSYIKLSANNQGELRLSIQTDLVSATTYFNGLSQPSWRAETEEGRSEPVVTQRQPDEFAEANVDIKRLSQLLSGQQMTPNKIVCNIVHDKIVQFFVLHDDVQLQYFLPVMAV